MRFPYLPLLAFAGLLSGFSSCGAPGVTFHTESNLTLNVSAITSALVGAGVPIEPGSNPQALASICCNSASCSSSPGCPGPVSAGTYTVDFACTASLCDPAPIDVASPPTAIDVAAQSSTYLTAVSSVSIESVDYTISKNTLTTSLEPIDIYWGSSGATAWNSTGTHHLGTVPAIAAGSTAGGSVALDSAGLAALNDYLASTAKQITLFYRTRVDLAPGEPIPGGELDVKAIIAIKASGTLR